MEMNETERLFRQHYAKMYRVARSLLYDEQESKDAVSDVFENLLHRSASLLPATEEAYLLTSVRNRCLKRLRNEEQMQRQPVTDMADEPADERFDDIMQYAVAHLSGQEQRIFTLRFAEGRSYAEIAAAEGISKVAVWKHLSHLLKQVKNHFNPCEQ